jgi:hypothetical protein
MAKNMLKTNGGRNALLCGLCTLVMMPFGVDASTSTAGSMDTATTALPTYAQRAMYGIQTLQGWYVQSSGLYQKPTDWWNSANAITVLVDYSRATHTTQYLNAVANTFNTASKAYGIANFTNDSNDDEGWWALAWIGAYDLTKAPGYLVMAQTIFVDMTTQWDTTACGAIASKLRPGHASCRAVFASLILSPFRSTLTCRQRLRCGVRDTKKFLETFGKVNILRPVILFLLRPVI